MTLSKNTDSMCSTSSLEYSKSVSRSGSQDSSASIDEKANVLKTNLDQMQKLAFEIDQISFDLKNVHFSSADSRDLKTPATKLGALNNSAQSDIRRASLAYQAYLEILQNYQESATCETCDEETKTEIIFHKVPLEAVERIRRLTNEQ